MRSVVALVWGLVFGAGLAISGMTNPAKVLAFLDVAGAWDPTLATVMGGAVAVYAAAYRLARGRDRSWLGQPLAIPTRRDLDSSLLAGAVLFGIGWGLVGLCPGPALANLSRPAQEIWIFVAAMGISVAAFRYATRERARAARR